MTDPTIEPPVKTGPVPNKALSPHWFSRIVLVFAAVVWFTVAVAGLVYPVMATEFVGIDLETRSAMSEFRAVFGGVPAALVVIHLVAASRVAWLRPGLLMATTLSAGLIGGRITSLVVDGVPGPTAWLFTGAEAFLLVLCLAGLWRLGLREPAATSAS